MQISEHQLIEIGKRKIRSSYPEILAFFEEKINEEVLTYDEEKNLEDFIQIQIEEALKLNFLSEEGVVKFIFLLLLVDYSFQESSEFISLKNEIFASKIQIRKNKLIDNVIYEITGFENYWRN